ncbi:MAG: NusG domain II-containing protein [Anaerovoracaceae bacterium]|jgi:hypothetical protein
MNNKFFKKADIVIIAIILIMSGIAWLIYQYISAGSVPKAEIYYFSELVETVELEKGNEMTFSVPQEEDVVFHLDAEGGIGFIQSDCPDQVCVRSGKLHQVGDFAACLPNGLILKIVAADSHDNNDADIIIGN